MEETKYGYGGETEGVFCRVKEINARTIYFLKKDGTFIAT